MTEQMRTKISSTLSKNTVFDVQSEKIEMTLNTDSAIASGLLIQRLTELYENPIEASVRETISNGLDAVAVSFSGTRPELKIESPSVLNPVITISDNGEGMTYEDLKNVYSRYGASTKQNNFDQIGAYGLGAKAPLAYGTQFTVSSTKNGQKTTIIVAREEMTNYIKVISSVETDEPSGTTVSIPVQSGDVDKFNDLVDLYKVTPADYNADLYIDEELVTNKFDLVTENAVLFSKGTEEVKARIWVDSNVKSLVELAGSERIEDELNSAKYVIGGWGYDSPEAKQRNLKRFGVRINSSNSRIFIELKPGLVSFNSSRDAILGNDRFRDLELNIKLFLKSEEFKNGLIEVISKKELNDFRKIMFGVVSKFSLSFKGSVFKVEGRYGFNAKSFVDLSKLVHEESGFSLENICLSAPTVNKNLATIKKEKQSNGRSSLSTYSEEINNDGWHRKPFNSSITSKDSYRRLIARYNLESSILAYVLKGLVSQEVENRVGNIFFVTDIPSLKDEEAENLVSKIFTKRNSILEYTTTFSEKNTNSHEVVFTSHSKEEIAKFVESSGLEVSGIKTHEEVLEGMKLEASNKTNEKKIPKENKFSPKLSIIEDNRVKGITVEVAQKIKGIRLVVMSKSSVASKTTSDLIKNWYCNKNKKNPEEVEVIFSSGLHRINDIPVLEDLTTEIYQYQHSDGDAGKSQYYLDNYSNKKTGANLFLDSETPEDYEVIFSLLGSVNGRNSRRVLQSTESILSHVGMIADKLGIEMTKVPREKMHKIFEGLEKFNRLSYYQRADYLGVEGDTQLVSLLDKSHYKAVSNLSFLISESQYSKVISINDAGELQLFSGLKFDKSSLSLSKELFEGENLPEFVKDEIAKTKRVIQYASEIVDLINSL